MRVILPVPILLALLLSGCLPRAVVVRGGVEMTQDEAVAYELEEARSLEADRAYEDAAARYEELARKYPRSPQAPEALYRAGRSWEAVGQNIKARAAYERLLEIDRTSTFVPLAEERLAALGAPDLRRDQERYDQLPIDRKFAEARRLAQDAEEAGSGAQALHWRKEAVQAAQTAPQREHAQEELRELVERLSTIELERLAASEPHDSIAAPLLAYRLAMVHQERRDWDQLEDALDDFTHAFADHPLAHEARELLEKILRRGEVDPTAIGVLLPLSGPYQAYGQQLLAGIEWALQGSDLRLIVRDSEGDPVIAEEQVERLLYEDHVMALIGGVLQEEAQAVAIAADELGLPAFTFSPTLPLVEESEWIFRDMLTNEAVAQELARFLVEDKGLTRVAVLHPDMPYGNEMRELFEAALLERGGEIRKVETYAQDATSFAEPIKKLVGRFEVEQHPEYYQRLNEIRAQNLDARRRRNAIERMRQSLSPQVDFDVIFLPDQWRTVSLVAPALAFEDVVTAWCDDWEIEKARKTTGHRVKPVLLLGVNLWNHPELPVRGGKYLQCSMFVDGWFQQSEREATVAFVDSFQRRHGRSPGMLEAYAAEAGAVLRHVMEQERPRTRRELRDRLGEARDVPGPMGPASINEKGEVEHELYLLSIDEGAIREGEPGQSDDDEEEAIP